MTGDTTAAVGQSARRNGRFNSKPTPMEAPAKAGLPKSEEKGEVVFAALPSFRLSYLAAALFADARTLAGGAYFLQSGFEQRSCSTHEQATRLSPFQKSQGVSSVHPQPRQARSLLIRSS